MRNVRMAICLMAAVVFFVTCQAYAGVFDHFDNGQLDPAWDVSLQNASGWSYAESGTNITVSDINVISGPANGLVFLKQGFLAPDNFVIKSGFSWNSKSAATMETLRIQAYSGNKVVAEGGYSDGWMGSGGPFAFIEFPLYMYGNAPDMLPLSGNAEITLKRTNGSVSILWNDQVVLTGYSDWAVDKVAIAFERDPYPGANFGLLSVDYINAVPEPATLLLLGLGAVMLGKRR